MNVFRKELLLTLAVGLLLSMPPKPVGATGGLRTVAMAGSAAPGEASTDIFGGFLLPVLNNAGQTAFLAVLESNSGESGIYSEGGGNGLALVARSGNSAPDTEAGVEFLGFSKVPLLNNHGRSAFNAFLSSSTNESGIFSEVDGVGLALIARSGDAVSPTGSDTTFSTHLFRSLAFNNNGQAAFMSSLEGTGVTNSNDFGVYRVGMRNDLTLVAREGDPAPVTRSGVNIEFPIPERSHWSVALNSSGQTAFVGWLSGTRVQITNNSGIFSEGGGNGLALVVRKGDAAPDTSAGVHFGDFNIPRLNNRGQTAFFAYVTGTDITNSNDVGLFSEGSGNGLTLVARDGSAAPGTEPGVSFDFNYRAVQANDTSLAFSGRGDLAFIAPLSGLGVTDENSIGLFSEGGGNGLALLARKGDAVPSLESEFKFFDFRNLAINSSGQTSFLASLEGTGSDATGSLGLFAEDTTGGLQVIARTGDLLDVSDNLLLPDLRTIKNLDFIGNSGNENGHASSFNDRGQVAFRATFTDGTNGIFVSNLVAVPEPSSLALFALAGLATGSLSRRVFNRGTLRHAA